MRSTVHNSACVRVCVRVCQCVYTLRSSHYETVVGVQETITWSRHKELTERHFHSVSAAEHLGHHARWNLQMLDGKRNMLELLTHPIQKKKKDPKSRFMVSCEGWILQHWQEMTSIPVRAGTALKLLSHRSYLKSVGVGVRLGTHTHSKHAHAQ